jgi:tetratricopeptide (TPR) repeat protein
LLGKKQLIAILVVILAVVGVYLLPKQPASVRKGSQDVEAAPADTSEMSEVEKAVALVQGSSPMEGIMKLREILEKDSTNVEALLYMGLFSVQSGQLDKARERFESVLRYEPGQLDAHWQLGQLDFDANAYQSAADHFEVCANSGLAEYTNAWFFQGRSLEMAGDAEGALKAYKTFRPMTQDTVIIKRLDEFIRTLEETINQ